MEKTDSGTSDPSEVTGKHQLRIIFDGVIAVGPPEPRDGGERSGPFFGVMARSVRQMSHRSSRLNENPPKFIPMHVPTVYTTLAPAADGRPPDEVFRLSRNDPKWFIWHPVRERLEFRFDGNGEPGPLIYDNVEGVSRKNVELRSGVKFHSIRRVPDARDIWPERSELLGGLMSEKTPVKEEAAAQILIPWGTVAGTGIFDKKEGVEVVFDPDRTSAGRKVVVPNVAVSVEAERVEIVSYSLDTGEKLDSLIFNVSDDAEIWISNGDPSDTAIDLEKMTDQLMGRDPKVAEELFLEHMQKSVGQILNVKAKPNDLSRFSAHVMIGGGGGGMFRPSILDDQIVRQSEVDIDFELFYTITVPPTSADDLGLPVPVKADLVPFEGPNCLVKQVECSEPLRMKSNEPR